MANSIQETAYVMYESNKEAAVISGKQVAGKILNDRLYNLVEPKVNPFLKGFIQGPMGRAALANLFSASLVHFGSKNDKLMIAADAMVLAAMDDLIGDLNLDQIANEFLDGVNLPGGSEPTPRGEV